jgi:hypothetical protein
MGDLPKMTETTDFEQLTDKLQHEIARLWDEYQNAPAGEKPAARARYLEALRRFSAHVNPS